MGQIRYKSYDALKQRLKRSSKTNPCLKQYGSLSTLLLETFLENNGYLSSKDYYKTIFETPGKGYQQWISELKEARVLVQYRTEGSKGSDFIRYAAGPLIVEYINNEKKKFKEIVTKDEVALLGEVPSKAEFEELKADAAELKARMNKIEETVEELKSAMEPPDTDDKQKRRKLAADRLTQLALVKSN